MHLQGREEPCQCHQNLTKAYMLRADQRCYMSKMIKQVFHSSILPLNKIGIVTESNHPVLLLQHYKLFVTLIAGMAASCSRTGMRYYYRIITLFKGFRKTGFNNKRIGARSMIIPGLFIFMAKAMFAAIRSEQAGGITVGINDPVFRILNSFPGPLQPAGPVTTCNRAG